MNPETQKHLRANLFMLLAAMIWGSAFVAQRLSLNVIGPFLYTGLRFLLGAFIVILFCLRPTSRREFKVLAQQPMLIAAGMLLGAILAAAISLQQIGLQYTKVAHAGFISSLYVVIVPLINILLGRRTHPGTWLGAILAVIGIYFLSVNETFSILRGDKYQLVSALLIALQMLLVDRFVRQHDPLALAFIQFFTCGALCLFTALLIEPIHLAAIRLAWPTIVYGGALSVGIGYTIQLIAQRNAEPAHAALIFSMEGAFAALAGWLILHETLSFRAIFGCIVMMTGLIVCQCLTGKRG